MKDLRDSVHPTHHQYLQYDCGGEIGGYLCSVWHDHGIDSLTSGHFIWLPLPLQLTLAGFHEQAKELNELVDAITGSNH